MPTNLEEQTPILETAGLVTFLQVQKLTEYVIGRKDAYSSTVERRFQCWLDCSIIRVILGSETTVRETWRGGDSQDRADRH